MVTEPQHIGRQQNEHPLNESGQGSDFLLWFGVLGSAIAWLLHLLLCYGIAEFGCVSPFREVRLAGLTGVTWLEIGASLLSLLLAAVATWTAQRSRRQLLGEGDAELYETGDPRVFMARTGVITGRIFVFIILVQTLPILYFLHDC